MRARAGRPAEDRRVDGDLAGSLGGGAAKAEGAAHRVADRRVESRAAGEAAPVPRLTLILVNAVLGGSHTPRY